MYKRLSLLYSLSFNRLVKAVSSDLKCCLGSFETSRQIKGQYSAYFYKKKYVVQYFINILQCLISRQRKGWVYLDIQYCILFNNKYSSKRLERLNLVYQQYT